MVAQGATLFTLAVAKLPRSTTPNPMIAMMTFLSSFVYFIIIFSQLKPFSQVEYVKSQAVKAAGLPLGLGGVEVRPVVAKGETYSGTHAQALVAATQGEQIPHLQTPNPKA